MPNVRVLMARPHRLLLPILRVIGQMKQRGEPSVLLVPEQFTLQAERELLKELALNGLFYIEVLSPSRLKDRVLAAVGTDARTPLSAAGQRLAVSIALEACGGDLKYYRASVLKRGFAQKLSYIIADMKRGGLSPDALKQYAETLPAGMRREKISDLAILYSGYEKTLGDHMGDGDDLNLFATRYIVKSGIVNGKHVFAYGFDALAEQMIALLCAIAQACDSLTVGLICDNSGAADQALYLPVRQSVARFRTALERGDIALTEVQLMPERLNHAPAIAHLDAVLFAHPLRRFIGEQNNVTISQFHSPFEEATAAARQIMRVYEQGIDLERILLLYPDQNGYPFAVSAALECSGLPYYKDEKLPTLAHGLPQFLLAALHAMADNFRSDDLYAMMKTGYAPLDFEETCKLENYAREYGIQFGRWLLPFRHGDDDIREMCEALRDRLIRPLLQARGAIVAADNVKQSLQAVMKLLTDVNAYDTLKREEQALLKENLLARAGQNSQIWQSILDLFDQMYILSNGRRIPLKHIAERFEAGFSAISLSALPPAAGMLHAGILGHSLSGEVDVVFLLGMNDGVLGRSAESLLTEEERAQAQASTGTFMGMTEESRLLFARLDLKRAMTLPKNKLYMSYAKTDPSGNSLQPLDLLIDLEANVFDHCNDLIDKLDELPISAQQAMITLSDLLCSFTQGEESTMPHLWKRRLAALLTAPSTALPAIQLLRAVGYHTESPALPPEIAEGLFGDRTLSVSRLEEFAACPFQHYVTYGLRPEEQKEWSVTSIETGNFLHECLQRFVKNAGKNPQFPRLSQQEIREIAEAAAEPLLADLRSGPMGDGPRNQALLTYAARVARRACETVADHLAAGAFIVSCTEAKFGYPGEDSFPPIALHVTGGAEITLHGRIDRIDSWQTPDAVYRRVIDYKSGSYATLDAAELWHGTQLQLMLYLEAVTRNTGEAKPAGAFYFHLFDPMSKVDDASLDAISLDIRKQLQMTGLSLAEPTVLQAMDGSDESVVVPSAFTQTGEMRKNAKALDEEHLIALMEHTKAKATQLSTDILHGVINTNPVRHGTKESCTYCTYRTVCGYDPLSSGARSQEIFSMTMEELKANLDQKTVSKT